MEIYEKRTRIFSWQGFPPIRQALPLALQHVVAMIVGCVTPSLVIAGSGVANLDAAQTTLLVQSALFIAGIATLLQLFATLSSGKFKKASAIKEINL